MDLDACDFEEQLYSNPNFYVGTGSGYPSQEYHGSTHGSYHDSIPNDNDDNNTISEEMSPVKPKKRATKKKIVEKETKNDLSLWTRKEEIALCDAWCDSSENIIMGKQKVIAYFEKEVGADRTYNSIITKWKNRIRPRVGQFCVIYDNAYRNYASGVNDLTIYRQACAEYQIVYKHAFVMSIVGKCCGTMMFGRKMRCQLF